MDKKPVVNREHKDRLFKFIFGSPERKRWTLDLYNAVNGSSYSDPDAIEINTIDDVLYMGMKNDVSFIVSDTVSVYEHQSTYCPNMPVRMLMYLGKLYDEYIRKKDVRLHGETLIYLPAPQFVVFYNGTDRTNVPDTLSLSDAFSVGDAGQSDVSITVHMRNVNFDRGDSLLQTCRPLYEYAWFIARLREGEDGAGIEAAVDLAIDTMPEDFQIKALLLSQKAKVKDMLLTEYDEAEEMRKIRQEGRAEGRVEGRAEGRVEGKVAAYSDLVQQGAISLPFAAERLGLTIDELRQKAKELGITIL